ncbi:MAG TPA: DUF5134 domain-containing protein [Amycolatopsis sp.]|nr:DUF5134 domain-containing protein [Amycolatopsis sp.]
MRNPLLPEWLRLVWAVLLVVVAFAHLRHVVTMRGQRRWWHIGHTLMAAGMAAMYLLPRMDHQALYRSGLALYVVVAVALAATTAAHWRREAVVNPLWVASTLDVVVMVYMLLPVRTPTVSGVFVVYLAGQAVAWALGLWSRVPALRPVPADGTAGTEPGGSATVAVGLTAHSSPIVLSTLAVMAASMAYMLIAM